MRNLLKSTAPFSNFPLQQFFQLFSYKYLMNAKQTIILRKTQKQYQLLQLDTAIPKRLYRFEMIARNQYFLHNIFVIKSILY